MVCAIEVHVLEQSIAVFGDVLHRRSKCSRGSVLGPRFSVPERFTRSRMVKTQGPRGHRMFCVAGVNNPERFTQ